MTNPIWMPYTQMKTAPEPELVVSGRGAVLTLADGRRILDCISSWWVTLHGHAQPEIAEAIADQARRLEQVIAAGFVHPPALELARRLVSRLPTGLAHVFYSDDGSTAVEVALKMAFQFWRNQGASRRTRFLAFEGGYHGDTLGAMSLSAPSVFNQAHGAMLFPSETVPFPSTWLNDPDVVAREEQALTRLRDKLDAHPGEFAAMFLEPLVQGAGGMRMCRPEFLREVETVLRRHEVLMVYDEVMTGFGRTGEWFASLAAGTSPDIVCLSKGITGGFLPLAATVCNEKVFAAFWDDDPAKALFHGHSYTANPLGCAAGVASFDLLERTEEVFRGFAARHLRHLENLLGHPRLARLRVCGTVAAMDLAGGQEGYLAEAGPRMRRMFLERGFLLRPLGNVIYLLPPYCLTDQELAAAYECILQVVDSV